jgi:enamine deaminase RidA (YjgF/YER057c/UK114 family)
LNLRILGNLLFLSGILPIADGKLAISGRLGGDLSVEKGQEAARIASLKVLAAAKQHLGGLDRLKKLVKLTVLMATTEQFVDHAPVAEGASDLFAQALARGRPRSVGLAGASLPIGAPHS